METIGLEFDDSVPIRPESRPDRHSAANPEMSAERALRHRSVSRVVPDERLEAACLAIAHPIAKAPAFTVRLFRLTLQRVADPPVRAPLQAEPLSQSPVFASCDDPELQVARREGSEPRFRER